MNLITTIHAREWRSADAAFSELQDDELRSWLNCTGLLTQKLRASCDDTFRLEVLGAALNNEDQSAWREILLSCGTTPCLFAQTHIPAATVSKHSWLLDLGDRPLGEALQTKRDVKRSSFRYSLVEITDGDIRVANEQREHWARQSDFTIAALCFTVTEVFLPGLANCKHQKLRDAC